jgi:RES domain-containing protein
MMCRIWRLVHKNYLASAFSGEGARLAGGRWNSEGFAVVYSAGSLSLALLEIIVHLEFKEALKLYKAIPVDVPEELIRSVEGATLPEGWNKPVPIPVTRLIGNAWIKDQPSPVLKVPSAIVPVEYNYLMNPVHPEINRAKVGDPIDLPLDSRVIEKLK